MLDSISIRNIRGIDALDIEFEFPESGIIVITGKNGAGKSTVIKCFNLLSDPNILTKSYGENAVNRNSQISFSISGNEPFSFSYNEKLSSLDSKDKLPREGVVVSELSIPFGARFHQYSKAAGFDAELRVNIASAEYDDAASLIDFLSSVYSSEKFSNLKSTKIKKDTFYFILKDNDYYVREDHFSSGEFFLIQLYRLITSGAELILIDELDVALDALAQVKLFSAIQPILREKGSRLIVMSHSLAFMSTVDEGGLYYLEDHAGSSTLVSRSFGYIKSDLFGFKGFDRYILTEDEVLEGFIEFVIKYHSVHCYYQHVTIGVAGVNQLRAIVEKNDSDEIFSNSSNVLCIVDGDKCDEMKQSYSGETRIVCSPMEDIEKYIYTNRSNLLSEELTTPPYSESDDIKRASKTYWKWLTRNKKIGENYLYQLVVEANEERVVILLTEIKSLLEKNY